MGHHWPVLLAALLIGAAVGYGLFQRERLEETAQVRSVVTPLPTVYVAVAPEGADPQHTTAAANPQAVQAPVSGLMPDAQPPANPGLNIPLPQILPGTPRGAAFTGLRAALIQKFGVMPSPGRNGGFALAADGVRVEADTGADWSIALYNNNPQAPTVQSDNFKTALNLVVANFELDLTAQPNTGADGKQTLRTASKVGRVSMITDPSMGNSITIKPLQKKPTVTQPGQPLPGQVQPGQMQAGPQAGGVPKGPGPQPPAVPKRLPAPVAPVAPPTPPVEQF